MSKRPETSTSKTRKKSKTNQPEPLLSSRNNPLAIDKASSPVKKAYKERFSQLNPILERGVDPTHIDEELKTLFEHHRWNNLIAFRTARINISLVREFFAALSATADFDAHNVVVVRKTSVIFNKEKINEFYGITNAPENTYAHKWELSNKKKLLERSREAQRHITPNPVWVQRGHRFKFDGVGKKFRIIKHVISFNILPTTHYNDFCHEEACLTHAFFNKEPINLGSLIFAKACQYAGQKGKSNIPFPGLISALCKKYKVTEFKDDEILDPCKILIGTRIFTNQESQDPHSEAGTSDPPLQAPNPDPYYAHLCAKIDTLDLNCQNMKDSFTGMMNDIRLGIRGMNDYQAYQDSNSLPKQFYSCQPEPYTFPPWTPQPPFDPTQAQTSTRGGESSYHAGTQDEDMKLNLNL